MIQEQPGVKSRRMLAFWGLLGSALLLLARPAQAQQPGYDLFVRGYGSSLTAAYNTNAPFAFDGDSEQVDLNEYYESEVPGLSLEVGLRLGRYLGLGLARFFSGKSSEDGLRNIETDLTWSTAPRTGDTLVTEGSLKLRRLDRLLLRIYVYRGEIVQIPLHIGRYRLGSYQATLKLYGGDLNTPAETRTREERFSGTAFGFAGEFKVRNTPWSMVLEGSIMSADDSADEVEGFLLWNLGGEYRF